MLYASEIYQAHHKQFSGSDENPDSLPNLIAEILCRAVEDRLHRNLTSAHIRKVGIRTRVRGKIRLLDTERHQLLQRGRVACSFDDLSVDTQRNRFILGALVRCSTLVNDSDLSHRCRRNAATLKTLGVTLMDITPRQLSRDQISRNDRADRLMLSAAKLAFEMRIPSESDGMHYNFQPEYDERWLRALFEKAVAGFYNVVASPMGWQVSKGKCLNWQIEAHSDRILDLLPRMKTDMILEHAIEQRRLIIDTKFTAVIKPGYYRELTVNQNYLYQIYAYVRSQVSNEDPLSQNASGLLLHAAIDEDVDEVVSIQGHCFRFATVNLAASSATIRTQLLRLLQ